MNRYCAPTRRLGAAPYAGKPGFLLARDIFRIEQLFYEQRSSFSSRFARRTDYAYVHHLIQVSLFLLITFLCIILVYVVVLFLCESFYTHILRREQHRLCRARRVINHRRLCDIARRRW